MVFALNTSGIVTFGMKWQAGELTGDVEFVMATIDSRRVIINKAPMRQLYKRSRNDTVRGNMEEDQQRPSCSERKDLATCDTMSVMLLLNNLVLREIMVEKVWSQML